MPHTHPLAHIVTALFSTAAHYGRAVVLALLFLLPQSAFALFVGMSDEVLIQQSELIVMGEWVGQTQISQPGGGTQTLGAIAISEVLKGPPAQTLALVVAVPLDVPHKSSDLIFRRGDKGLWFLRKGEGGLYLVDHPQRFIAQSSGAGQIQALRKKIVRP